MDDLTFTIKGDNGETIKCDILFTFIENNKNYIIYTDNELDENGDPEILAAIYTIDENNNLLLEDIETDAEWDMVDQKINERFNEAFEDESEDYEEIEEYEEESEE